MLSVNSIEVVFDNFYLVLKGISLEVPERGIVALLGANGAGKTTILKAIAGIVKSERGSVTDGNIEFMGNRIENASPSHIFHLGVAMVPEGGEVFDQLTVEENLLVCFQGKRKETKDNFEMIFDYFPPLRTSRKKLAGWLSGGEQQMLAIGRSLMARPKLMLLDEPSLGLAPILANEAFSIIKKINEERGVAILVVEQNANIALSLSRYGYIMENGRIVIDGETEKLRENEDVREFYLGMSSKGEKKKFHDIKHYKRRKRWLS